MQQKVNYNLKIISKLEFVLQFFKYFIEMALIINLKRYLLVFLFVIKFFVFILENFTSLFYLDYFYVFYLCNIKLNKNF